MKQEPMSYVVPAVQGQGDDGDLHPVYEGRRELICVCCHGAIAKGAHFTKQRPPNLQHGNRKIYPCCSNCYHFVEVVDGRPQAAQVMYALKT